MSLEYMISTRMQAGQRLSQPGREVIECIFYAMPTEGLSAGPQRRTAKSQMTFRGTKMDTQYPLASCKIETNITRKDDGSSVVFTSKPAFFEVETSPRKTV